MPYEEDEQSDETAKNIERKPVMETTQECADKESALRKSCREIREREKLFHLEIMCLWELWIEQLWVGNLITSQYVIHFFNLWIHLLSDYPCI